jgi:hypothetical protein
LKAFRPIPYENNQNLLEKNPTPIQWKSERNPTSMKDSFRFRSDPIEQTISDDPKTDFEKKPLKSGFFVTNPNEKAPPKGEAYVYE